MANVLVDETALQDIADAIRTKNGTQNTYKPGQMADAIEAIPSGGITPTGTVNINSNGTHNVAQYASANVNVPNSYAASDEGKVVSNGALVAQGSDTVTQNGTVDTTLIKNLTVNVPSTTPTGTKQIPITQNGTVTEDVTNYASAEITVNVPTGSGVTRSTFEISAEDAETYKTSLYTVSEITCDGYVICAQRTSTNGQYWWMYTPFLQTSQYLNGSNSQMQGSNALSTKTNSSVAKLVNNHPVIKGTNASFPLVAGTYDIIYW